MEGWQLIGIEELCCLGMVFIKVASHFPAFTDLCTGFIQDNLIIGIFPPHKFADNLKELFPLAI
ncbi:MAG TPA: hypothetical protein PKI59_02435, partial [Candidatus Cloacimonadota bacterium]|nr:hypothetical protein [Candidatus Cloacimonadota bacterium]